MFVPKLDLFILQRAGMWVFLLPLIVILGTADILSRGQSRNWPFPARNRAR